MKIEPEDLQQFQRLWKEHFHTEISDEDANTKANFLLNMMLVVYRPLPNPCVPASDELFPQNL